MFKVTLSVLAFVAFPAGADIFPTEPFSNSITVGFLKDIQKLDQFQSILILKNSNQHDEDLIRNIAITLEVPVILCSEKSSFFVKDKFSSNLLAIVYLESVGDDDILYALSEDLDHMRSSKTFFLLNYPSKEDEVLMDLFNFCWTNRMINILAVFRDFPSTLTYYRYTNIPKFVIEENSLMDGPPANGYFPDRMRDLKGHELPVIFGGSEPKTIIWKNKYGGASIGGYAGHLFLAMAKKHNANLSSPILKPNSSAVNLIFNYINNDIVDISTATTYPWVLDPFTYPYEFIDWCIMLPIEPKIPIYQIFMIIFQWEALLITIAAILILSALLESAVYLSGRKTIFLNYIIHDSCLRGALAQSFIEIPNASHKIRLVYLLICLIGIILVTSYDAFLQTYLYSPPSEKKIGSLDDLLASGLKVYFLETEFYFLQMKAPEIVNKYFDVLQFEQDFAKFVKIRDSFNTSIAYLVNNNKWITVQEQQKLFKNPLFRQDSKMCLLKGLPMSFPINENSIYRDIVNFLILEVYSSGLLEFWQRRAFFELIEAGKLKFPDLAEKPDFVPLKVEDLKLIWLGMVVASGLACLCFLAEICIFKWKARRDPR